VYPPVPDRDTVAEGIEEMRLAVEQVDRDWSELRKARRRAAKAAAEQRLALVQLGICARRVFFSTLRASVIPLRTHVRLTRKS